jgi:hypothetical protein
MESNSSGPMISDDQVKRALSSLQVFRSHIKQHKTSQDTPELRVCNTFKPSSFDMSTWTAATTKTQETNTPDISCWIPQYSSFKNTTPASQLPLHPLNLSLCRFILLQPPPESLLMLTGASNLYRRVLVSQHFTLVLVFIVFNAVQSLPRITMSYMLSAVSFESQLTLWIANTCSFRFS